MGGGRERCARMGFFVGCKSWERKGALCEDGFFVGCKSWERKRAVCRMGFFVGCKSGERTRGNWEEGRYFWPEEPIQPLLKKLLPKILE
jgi:hypothetical protein